MGGLLSTLILAMYGILQQYGITTDFFTQKILRIYDDDHYFNKRVLVIDINIHRIYYRLKPQRIIIYCSFSKYPLVPIRIENRVIPKLKHFVRIECNNAIFLYGRTTSGARRLLYNKLKVLTAKDKIELLRVLARYFRKRITEMVTSWYRRDFEPKGSYAIFFGILVCGVRLIAKALSDLGLEWKLAEDLSRAQSKLDFQFFNELDKVIEKRIQEYLPTLQLCLEEGGYDELEI